MENKAQYQAIRVNYKYGSYWMVGDIEKASINEIAKLLKVDKEQIIMTDNIEDIDEDFPW